MRTITLADRLRYWFDNTISRGTVALIGWLFAVIVALVLASSLLVYATGIAPGIQGQRLGLLKTIWLTLMRTIDPGNVGGDEGSWPFLLAMLAVTAGGISLLFTPVGGIFSGIEKKNHEPRPGRSFFVGGGGKHFFWWASPGLSG